MTSKELLEINGNFKQSPLLDTIHRLHNLLTKFDIPYAIIGGMAVIRNGAFRTTHDIDILTTHTGWERLKEINTPDFSWEPDAALDKKNGISIDLLFAGDDWDLVFLLPQPEEITEYDEELGAFFANLQHIIELKLAVYKQREKEEGPELAAKDLADVVELVKHNLVTVDENFITKFHPDLQSELRRIVKKVQTIQKKKPK